jgi:transposase
MIGRRTILEIYQLKEQGFAVRSIARQLQIDRETVAKYLAEPRMGKTKHTSRKSKLDPYKDMIDKLIEQCPDVKAPVVLQRLRDKGFDGEITIVRDMLRQLRGKLKNRQAFIRFESEPGEQLQVDWGHFPCLSYGTNRRKLYALAVVEGHSRMLYVYFSHSQRQEYLHQGLLEAFTYFNGTAKEIVVDNMLTAVTERVGTVIRYNDAFLEFLSKFGILVSTRGRVLFGRRTKKEKWKMPSNICAIISGSYGHLPDLLMCRPKCSIGWIPWPISGNTTRPVTGPSTDYRDYDSCRLLCRT